MNTSTTERLAEFMSVKGINNNMITVTAGLSIGQIGKAISNNSGINSTSIEKILHAYPELNPEWLLTGKGEMLKVPAKGEEELVTSAEKQQLDYKVLYEEAKYTLELQKKYIENLESQLKNLED
ncbi:hypothetical protein [Flavobacterium phragmitis]|uniref:HTH cro/C1-type domain-containing protein n=1 Tax=Flavobacterium phragmitis TaxID=739143 RepID=A0A1I1K3V2_9FLAO|nr:hypothetical protein [Flavobacterium phragmitis]SFC53408.1 hypothetical protein SAMN05216297_101167 [Flavobacterium phragmitis]